MSCHLETVSNVFSRRMKLSVTVQKTTCFADSLRIPVVTQEPNSPRKVTHIHTDRKKKNNAGLKYDTTFTMKIRCSEAKLELE